MNKLFKSISVSAIALCLAVSSAFAAGNESNCQVVYGGGEVCPSNIAFTIDKKVQQPTKGGEFVDNLSINDSKFQLGANIVFSISIKNTGNNKIDRLDVVDSLPQNVTFVSGVGNYNKDNNTITYSINNLDKGQTNNQTFVAQSINGNNLPQNAGIVCLVNKATATDNNGTQATDTSSFCIQKPIVNLTPTPQIFEKVTTKQIPATGPEMLPLIGLIPAGLTGFYLRRKSNQ